jgi:hypothetical protein
MKKNKVITIRVVLSEEGFAVKIDPRKKRVFINAETIEQKEDGSLAATSATPAVESIIETEM